MQEKLNFELCDSSMKHSDIRLDIYMQEMYFHMCSCGVLTASVRAV